MFPLIQFEIGDAETHKGILNIFLSMGGPNANRNTRVKQGFKPTNTELSADTSCLFLPRELNANCTEEY